MKVSFKLVKSAFSDFLLYRNNREEIKLWINARKANRAAAKAVEDGVARMHGQEFAVYAGKAWITCECDNKECILGDFVDQETMMDVATPKTKFIHRDCEKLRKIMESHGSIIVGDLGQFKVISIEQ